MIRRAWALLSVVPIVIGACVILGWMTQSPALTELNQNYLSLQFSSAACLLITGLGLLLYIYPSEFTRDAQMIIGLLLLAYAALSVSQDILNINLHLEEITTVPGVTSFYQHPGRAAPNTALGFMLLGAIFICMPIARIRLLGMLVECFIFFLILISVLALLGHYWRIDFLYSWANYRAMPFSVAVCFAIISLAMSGIWRGKSASIQLYQGREDTRIIMLSSAILLSMALAITIANFSSLISQQKEAIGASFQRLQKSRSIFFQNEVVQAIQGTNTIRDSQVFQNEISKSMEAVSFADFDPILKLFTAEGFSAVSIYNDKGAQVAGSGTFIQQAEFNIKEKISNGFINVLWKNGWYVQIATDITNNNKKYGYIVTEWPLHNLDKVFTAAQMMGETGDIEICMQAEKDNITCYSSRAGTVSTGPGKVANLIVPAEAALQGKSGLLTTSDREFRQVLAAYGPIGVLHLSMVVEMSVLEIFAPITKSLRTMIPEILVTMLIGLVLLRLQAMPLLRRMIQAERGLMTSNARLEESEKRYALAIRGSSTGLWDWDFVKDTYFYSPYFKGMLGYTDTEFPNTMESFKNVLHHDDYARVFNHLEQHLRNQVPFDIECRLKRKIGDYHWFLARGLALWDVEGNAVRMVGSLLDVTERKRSEQRLAAQYAVNQLLSTATNLEEVLGKIIEVLCVNLEWDFGSAWLVDNRSATVHCIDVWAQTIPGVQALVAVERKAAFPMGVGLAGRVWETGEPLWVYDLSTDKNFPYWQEASQAGLHSAFCFPVRLQNKVLGVLEFMMRQRQGPDEAMLKMMTAITAQIGSFAERKATEWSLRESESYKAAVLDSASDGILTVNAGGDILSHNQRTSDIFGYTPLEVGQIKMDTLMPGLTEKFKLFSGKIAAEVDAVRKDGQHFPAEITLSKMYLSKQNVFVCIVRDITERKKMERLKSDFVSVVSSELRTPISAIRAALERILADKTGQIGEQARALLAGAETNCDRLLLMINDILDIEKIEANKMDFQFKPMDVSDLIQQAVTASQARATQRQVNLQIEGVRPGILLYVDPERMLRVVMNLIVNAISYAPSGSTVNVTMTLLDDRVHIAVADHGPLIPAAYHATMFQKFPPGGATEAGGRVETSLGLSISQAIIEKFGGTLGFTSVPHEPTIFYLELPQWHQAEVDGLADIVTTATTQPCKMLVCEGQVNEAAYLQQLLASIGCEAEIAHTVSQARTKLRENGYQGLVLHLVYPDQGGIALIRKVRDDEKTQAMPVLVMSPRVGDEATAVNGAVIEIVDWLDKPVDFNKLLKSIERVSLATQKKIPHILHIDNDVDARRIISTFLHDCATVDEADTVVRAREKILNERFDLVMIDFLLPDGNSAELLTLIAERRLPIIVFSAVELDQEYARYFHEALEKPQVSSENLLTAIEKMMQLPE